MQIKRAHDIQRNPIWRLTSKTTPDSSESGGHRVSQLTNGNIIEAGHANAADPAKPPSGLF